jgi:hypothetical protein
MNAKTYFKLAYGAARRSYVTRSGLTVVCPGGTPAIVRTLFRAKADPWLACHLAIAARKAAAARFTAPTPCGVAYIQPIPE